MCVLCPFIQEKLDFLSILSLFLNSFCLNKSRSMPKLQFLTACESPESLTEENVCKVVSNNTDSWQKPWCWICLAKNLVGKQITGKSNIDGERSSCFVLVKTYFSSKVPGRTEEGLLIIWCMLFYKMSASAYVYWVVPPLQSAPYVSICLTPINQSPH